MRHGKSRLDQVVDEFVDAQIGVSLAPLDKLIGAILAGLRIQQANRLGFLEWLNFAFHALDFLVLVCYYTITVFEIVKTQFP